MDQILSLQFEDSETPNRQKRRNYTLSFKSEVVEYAVKTNNCRASQKYGVPRQCIQRWINMYGSIKEVVKDGKDGNRRRVGGGGRNLNNSELDESLAEYVRQKRKENQRISRSDIQRHARLIAGDTYFKASNGWLQRFMIRHGFALRRPTTSCQTPEEFQERIIEFLLYVEELKQQKKYDYIYACDETEVCLDFTDCLTMANEGTSQMSTKSHSHNKNHITVMLTARHDGIKCRPFVLLPQKRPVEEIINKFAGKLDLSWCGKTFFNNPTTEQYLETTMGSQLLGNRLLVWDSFKSHISENTKNVLKKLKIDTAVIPEETTKYIQASDVYWKSDFKSKIRDFYKAWISAGNMQEVPMETYLRWIVDAWDSLPEDLIQKSFVGCGLNNDVNGEDDDKIHCLNNCEEFTSGIQQLKEKRYQRLKNSFEDFLNKIVYDQSVSGVESDDSLEFEF